MANEIWFIVGVVAIFVIVFYIIVIKSAKRKGREVMAREAKLKEKKLEDLMVVKQDALYQRQRASDLDEYIKQSPKMKIIQYAKCEYCGKNMKDPNKCDYCGAVL